MLLSLASVSQQFKNVINKRFDSLFYKSDVLLREETRKMLAHLNNLLYFHRSFSVTIRNEIICDINEIGRIVRYLLGTSFFARNVHRLN